MLDGISTEIAGVLPPDFRSPNDERLGDQIKFLRPFAMRPDLVDNRGDHELEVIGAAEGPASPVDRASGRKWPASRQPSVSNTAKA